MGGYRVGMDGGDGRLGWVGSECSFHFRYLPLATVFLRHFTLFAGICSGFVDMFHYFSVFEYIFRHSPLFGTISRYLQLFVAIIKTNTDASDGGWG